MVVFFDSISSCVLIIIEDPGGLCQDQNGKVPWIAVSDFVVSNGF